MKIEKDRAKQLRRKLNKYGYTIKKSRLAESGDNFGEYMIVDFHTNCLVRGERFDVSLDEVEDFLRDLEKESA